MGKDKKKHSKKNQIADDILDVAAVSVKKFRKVTRQVARLSTGQKLVGGIALLAAGLTYLAKQQSASATADDDAGTGASEAPKLLEAGPAHAPDDAPAALPRKSRKTSKAK